MNEKKSVKQTYIVKKDNKEMILTLMCISVIIVFLISFLIINFCGFPRFCNSDMYEDLFVSKLIWEQKKIFPDGWIFGNQYYVIATPVWAALFYGLTHSMNKAMMLATTFMTLAIILSLIWMLKAFSKEKLSIWLAIAVLLGVMPGPQIVHSEPGQIFYLCASYYACYLITEFVVAGIWIRDLNGKKCQWQIYAFGLLLCFATGMQSLRQMTVMVMPLCFLETLRLIIIFLKHKKLDKTDLWISARVLGYAIANAIGFIVVKLINPVHHSIFGNMTLRNSISDFREGILMGIRYLCRLNGISFLFYKEFRLDYLLLGIYCLPFIAMVIFFVIDSIRGKIKEPINICGVLMLTGIAATYAVGCVFKVTLRPIYYFLWYPLVMISVVYVFNKLHGRIKSGFVICILGLLLVNFVLSYVSSIKEAMTNEPLEEEVVCHYLEENGYKYLYGSWVVAPEIAVYSDGAVTAGGWYDDIFVVLDYLNPHGIYAAKDNDRALIILKKNDNDNQNENKALEIAQDKDVDLTLMYETEHYVLYKASEQLMIEK